MYISVDGGPDSKMFAQGASGSREADWIESGKSFESRLYAGKDRKQLLGKAAVSRPPLIESKE